MAQNIIILGMARSDTNLTASIFARKGYFVTYNNANALQSADKSNPPGYWEANSLVNFNKEILRAVNYQCDNTWFHAPITHKQPAFSA